MKRRLCALTLCLLLPLGGCSAMLERSYTSVQPHTLSVTGQQSGSALEAQSYQQLVSAVLYLVTQHQEEGIIRLYNYTGDAQTDLDRACQEVAKKDPLGAFAVDTIKHDVSRIVSFYEAQVDITYLRSAEEMAQITPVTGSSAIKTELSGTLSRLEENKLLRLSYYSEEHDRLTDLIGWAYYDTPQTAFGLPQATITLYPDTGIQRIVEIDLTYPQEIQTMQTRQEELLARAEHLLGADPSPDPRLLYDLLLAHVQPNPEGGSTAYDALIAGSADSEGLALAYKLLCDEAGVTCTVVQGQGSVRFWNIVSTTSGSRHVDCASGRFGLTDQQIRQLDDYQWEGSYPFCRDGSEL